MNNFMQKVARAHVRRRKLLKKGEAEGGEATPLGAEGGEATPGAEGGEATPLGAEGGEATPLGEAAPGSPEPVPEVPWPAYGVKVAVGVEHLMHSLRLGETGVSEGPAPDDPLEVIVKLDTAGVLAPMRIPRSLLVPVGAPMSTMRFWDKCTETVKRGLLWKVGVRDPRDEELPTTTSVSLTLWGEYVPIGLRLNEVDCKIKFVPPAFVNAFEGGIEMIKRAEAANLDEYDSYDDLEDAIARQEFRQ